MQTRLLFTGTLLLLLLCAQKAVAQPCACPGYDENKIKDLRRAKDSAGTFAAIQQFNSTGITDCQIKALSAEIEYRLTFKQVTAVPPLLEKQEKLLEKSDCTGEHHLQYYQNQSYYCKITQEYEGLSKYAFLMLELAEKEGDVKKELTAIDFIVFLFSRQKQDEKNWDYVKRAEKLIYKDGGKNSTANNYNWLAAQYEKKYATTLRLSALDSAVAFAAKAKELAGNSNDNIEMMKAFRIYEAGSNHRNEYKKAILYIDSALLYLNKLKILTNPSSLYFAKAWDYMELKEYSEAQRWMDSSMYYAEKFEGRSPATMTVYKEAARLFEKAGNTTKAYQVFKMYEHIKDSTFTLQRTEKINELEQKYNKTKNEKTIRELAQQKRIYLLLALAGLLGTAAIAFFLRQQALRHKKNILETEQRLNRARMNPHFFFNALTALQKFAVTENNPQAMASNLSKFSNIMRETLESTYKEYVTIEQEMEFLNEYLEVQKIRFPQAFSYEVSAAKELDIDELQIPAMIIQPFVENSIEHGFAGVDYPGRVTVQFEKEPEGLLVKITDNGKGLGGPAKETNEHISRASQIIKDRIYLLNIKLKTRAGFSIDNNPHGGVLVNIHLPLLYK